VQSLPIVNVLNEADDTSPCVRGSIAISQSCNFFLLQGLHEALRTRIVIRIAHPAHTRLDPRRVEDVRIAAASALHSLSKWRIKLPAIGVRAEIALEIAIFRASTARLARKWSSKCQPVKIAASTGGMNGNIRAKSSAKLAGWNVVIGQERKSALQLRTCTT
jgi:hypothetical protein